MKPLLDKNLGYYTCNGIDFFSKIEACVYATQTKQPLQWHFHDAEYANYKWHHEPEETLDQLYDRRARELREQYDYIAISYSGGSDSHNIVQSFARQGLHIDEIITIALKATDHFKVLDERVTDPLNTDAEHELQAIPRLKELSNLLPRTKITIVDTSVNCLDRFKNSDESWVFTARETLSIGYPEKFNYFSIKSIKEQLDKGKQVAVVDGIDKPNLSIDKNVLTLYFLDSLANGNNAASFNTQYTNAHLEFFYWAKSTAPMVCKQAHVVKRWLEMNPNMQRFWTVGVDNSQFGGDIHIRNSLLRNVIYSTWDDTWFQADKPMIPSNTAWATHEYDAWLRTSLVGTREYNTWVSGVNYVLDNAKDFVVRKSDKHSSLALFKQQYFIGKLESSK